MPSIFRYYIDRAEPYSCQGKSDELIVVTRKGKRESSTVMNNDRQALLQDNTTYSNGDLVVNKSTNAKYFIVALQSSGEANQAQLKFINATIDITRVYKHYTGTTQDYLAELPLHSDVPTFYEDITGRMMQYDAGLKSTSTRRFLVPTLDIKLLDRIKFHGENMCVDGINSSNFPGLLSIQCSPDTRVTKVIT